MQRTQLFSDRLTRALARVLQIQRMHTVLQRAIPSIIESLGIIGLLGITVMLVVNSPRTTLLAAFKSIAPLVALNTLPSAIVMSFAMAFT